MTSFPLTLNLLSGIASNDGSFIAMDMLEKLLQALELDGLHCSSAIYGQPPPITSNILTNKHHLRSLRESTMSIDDHNQYFTALGMVLLCLICAGLASGLTQGLLSLDLMEMTIKQRSGTPEERLRASKVLPVISRHHLLLVTLMLWNASATEALPVFLSYLVPEYLAVIFSVTMVLFVGEIIPAAIITGPRQLQIAAGLVPLVYLVNFVFFPVAYPISLVLDYALGRAEGMTLYTKKEIATLMIIQHEEVTLP